MPMPSAFFAMLFRMKYIQRWSLMHSSVPESLSTHTLETALVAHALALIGNTYFGKNYDPDRIAAGALYHDVPEILTGDIPTPVKYFSKEMKKAYDAVESAASDKFMAMLPAELRDAYAKQLSPNETDKPLIKAADKITALIKCVVEEQNGSKEFLVAKKTLEASLEELDCEEADYFIEHFLPGFSSTLDALLLQ